MPKRWIRDQREVETLLENAMVGRLGTAVDDVPYVTPVNFVYRSGRIYFHSGGGGRKLENIAANPMVCFEVDEVRAIHRAEQACDFSCRYRSVIAFGRARTVDDPEEKRRVLDWVVAKYADGAAYGPPRADKAAVTTVVEIIIDQLTGKENVGPPL